MACTAWRVHVFEPGSVPDETTDEIAEPTSEEATDETTEDAVEADPGSVLKLSRANVPATIPLHDGFHDGGAVFHIITDSSDMEYAEMIGQNQEWNVEVAPLLVHAPDAALSKTFVFTNGMEGGGAYWVSGRRLYQHPCTDRNVQCASRRRPRDVER